jgi:SH3-like domain-containing protein
MDYYKGKPITILERGANLTQICDADGYECWVRTEQIKDSAVSSKTSTKTRYDDIWYDEGL